MSNQKFSAEKPTEICRFKVFGIKDTPKKEQYLAFGRLVTETCKLE